MFQNSIKTSLPFLIFALALIANLPQQIYCSPDLLLPYTKGVIQQIALGDCVTVIGVPNYNADYLEVNFNSEFPFLPLATSVFHLSARFNSKQLIFNTFKKLKYAAKKDWGEEESYQNPFQRNIPFNLKICVCSRFYEISLNNKYFYKYKHRAEFYFNFYQVTGNLTLNHLSLKSTSTCPQGPLEPTNNYTDTFPNNHLSKNDRLAIHGIAANDFSVNFQKQSGSIGFRLETHFAEKKIVLKYQNEGFFWGPETTYLNIDLLKNQNFIIYLANYEDGIMIQIKGFTFVYPHKVDNYQMDYKTLYIDGDVKIFDVEFNPY